MKGVIGNRLAGLVWAACALVTASRGFGGQVYHMDDGDAGYAEQGAGWVVWTGDANAYSNDLRFSNDEAVGVLYAFTNVTSGRYLAYAGWANNGGRTTGARYSLLPQPGARRTVSQLNPLESDIALEDVAGANGAGLARLGNRTLYVADGTVTILAERTGSFGPGRAFVADVARLESVRSDVEAVYVIDAGEGALTNNAGVYRETAGTWQDYLADPYDHRAGIRYSVTTNASATFAFGGLPAGWYRVGSSWTASPNRPTVVTNALAGGPAFVVNQQVQPRHGFFEESRWQDFCTAEVGADGALEWRVAKGSNTLALIADAVRVERLPLVDDGGPGYQELAGAWTGVTNSPDRLGGDERASTSPDAVARFAFTNLTARRVLVYASFRPVGTAAAEYALDGGRGVIGVIGQAAWRDHDFWPEVHGADSSAVPGFARVSSRVFDVPDGNLVVTVRNAGPAGSTLLADAVKLEGVAADVESVHVVDSEAAAGNAGTYAETGSWADWQADPGDHRLSIRFVTAGSGAVASFRFADLAPGLYRVSATWTTGGGRPTDAVYRLADGSVSATVNQRVAPVGDWFEDVFWQALFTTRLVGANALVVELTNPTGGTAIADAVRLERLRERGGTLLIVR